MGTPAVANEHAASAAADMMHAALLKRTQHTQAVQLRAVAMRLKHEQATVAALRTQLDDMEDRADEAEEEVGDLLEANEVLQRDLDAARMTLRQARAENRARAVIAVAEAEAEANARVQLSWQAS